MQRLVSLAVVLGALACPGAAIAQSGTYGSLTLNSGFSDDPTTIQVQAVGTRTFTGCTGYFPEQPTFVLNYIVDEVWPLAIFLESTVDTVLLVRGPSGAQCDDDGWSSEGLGDSDAGHPMLMWEEPAGGLYYIYAGTYQPQAAALATVQISEEIPEMLFGEDW